MLSSLSALAIQTDRRSGKIAPQREIKNTNVFCHLETCRQTTHQDESETGKRYRGCNRQFWGQGSRQMCEWMGQKRQKRRGFLKIHVAVDVKSKRIAGLDVTDDKSHDSKSFVSLAERSRQSGNVPRVPADGAYDTRDDLVCLCHEDITAGTNTGKNSSTTTSCHPRRKSVLAQLYSLDLWKRAISCGDRRTAEGVFPTFRRVLGEHVTSHRKENMIAELKMKVCLYNKMVAMQ